MAFNLTQLQAATDEWWFGGGKTTDIYHQGCALQFKMMGKGRFEKGKFNTDGIVDGGNLVPDGGGGTQCRVPLRYAPTSMHGWGPTNKYNKTSNTTDNAARFDWCGAGSSTSVGLREERANKGGPARVNMLRGRLENLRLSAQRAHALELYMTRAWANQYAKTYWSDLSSNTDSFMDGLPALFGVSAASMITGTTLNTPNNWSAGANTVAYGDLQENDCSPWSPNLYTTAAEIGNETMQMLRRLCASGGSTAADYPDLILTSDVLKDSFANIAFNFTEIPVNTEMVNLGFFNYTWEGIDVVYDPFIRLAYDPATARTASSYADKVLIMLNTRFLHLFTDPDYAWTKPEWGNDADDPNNKVAGIRWQGFFVCNHRQRHCMATQISAAS